MEEKQRQYDSFAQTSSIQHQEMLCGPKPSVSRGNELYYLENYSKNNILDIGCGTGHRTFPEYINKNIKYFGIEKFDNLINASRFKSNIIQGDICSSNFILLLEDENLINEIGVNFDLTVLLGGVVNSFISNEYRDIAWKNISLLLNRSKYVLFDTLTHFSWYEIESKGKTIELPIPVEIPPQYFYSKLELENIFTENRIEIIESKSEFLPGGLKRCHFLISQEK